VRFLQIRETHGLTIIEKDKANPEISAFTYFERLTGNYFGANNWALRQLWLGNVYRLQKHAAARASAGSFLHQLRMHRARPERRQDLQSFLGIK
jgi:hypothetical protein